MTDIKQRPMVFLVDVYYTFIVALNHPVTGGKSIFPVSYWLSIIFIASSMN